MENSMKFPQKFKAELPYEVATPLLSMYPKEMESRV
jgi:hypothetical protein